MSSITVPCMGCGIQVEPDPLALWPTGECGQCQQRRLEAAEADQPEQDGPVA